ncbi:MAG: J domain-containing protein [Arthrobacter sp.]|nr:J domain-containing protein [Arthrobacter sp.]
MSSSEDDYYGLLGLEPGADAAQIRRAFRKLSREHHPDVGGDRRSYERITVAYAVLADERRREAYDAARSGGRAGASPAPEAGRAGNHATSSGAARRSPKPVRVTGQGPGAAEASLAAVPLHGVLPKRGLLDRTREARTAAVRELLRLVTRELPATRAVLGVDLPGAGRHDAVLLAGSRAVIIDVLPTPDTAHAWDGRTLRVGGKVATLPNVSRAAASLERAAGGTRAEGLAVLVTSPPDGFRPVVDRVGPVHAPDGPANLVRSAERVTTFLAGGANHDAVDLSVLARVLSLATHR